MNNNYDLVAKLTKDVNNLQYRIEHRKLYNLRNLPMALLIKSGIFVDYAIPFILSSIIIANIRMMDGDTPFIRDTIGTKSNIETIDTSNGIHLERISYHFDYGNDLIEHTTGWSLNNEGLYERIVTSYKINDEIDLSDTENILSMTKEELENIFIITNIETIKKKSLTPDDSIYKEEAVIVVNHFEGEEIVIRQESLIENVLNSILYILFTLGLGIGLNEVKNLFVKTCMRDKIRKYEPTFRLISKKELETMKKILELKKKNLEMINGIEGNINNNLGYSRRLRKR